MTGPLPTLELANKSYRVLSAGKPMAWPDGNVIAFCPIVAWETWPEHLGTPQSRQRSSRASVPPNARWQRDEREVQEHEYAETEGIWHLLDMFDRLGVKATFVASGRSLERFPQIAKECERRGHDMASENYIHEYAVMYTFKEEQADIAKTVAAFENVLGHHPRGCISPGHRPSDNTLDIVAAAGYIWDADFEGSDRPNIIEVGGKPFVAMPYAHISDYRTYDLRTTPREVAQMLSDEFDGLYAYGVAGQPRMVGYAFHPFLCHPWRLRPIEDFFRYAQRFSKVWFPTRHQIARWMLENYL